jgi:hypothetical protein
MRWGPPHKRDSIKWSPSILFVGVLSPANGILIAPCAGAAADIALLDGPLQCINDLGGLHPAGGFKMAD